VRRLEPLRTKKIDSRNKNGRFGSLERPLLSFEMIWSSCFLMAESALCRSRAFHFGPGFLDLGVAAGTIPVECLHIGHRDDRRA
jgi:hypothetical protein